MIILTFWTDFRSCEQGVFSLSSKVQTASKVAFVHDWLVTYRGGEKVLAELLKLFPNAPIYTLFYDPDAMPDNINMHPIHLPGNVNRFRKWRKAMLPLLPSLIESFDLSDYDLVISTSSCVAKGVIPGPGAVHVSYIHSPMRYIWDQKKFYLSSLRKIPGIHLAIEILSSYLRSWDYTSNHRVDFFAANSHFVKDRIKRFYNRDATVIHPPVTLNVATAEVSQKLLEHRKQKGPYFIIAGAFVSYKRFDLAIKACKLAKARLVIAGSGPEEKNLRTLADGKNCEFFIKPAAEHWQSLLAGAEAFLFPGVEDFGITPVEALALGTPIIAFARGGALDFVTENETGTFFFEQTPEALADTIKAFAKASFDRAKLQAKAESFSREVFIKKFQNLLSKATLDMKQLPKNDVKDLRDLSKNRVKK